MGRKTVSLRGDAAKAFLGLTGHVTAKTDDEELMEVATAIYLNMKTNDNKAAVRILKAFRLDCQKKAQTSAA